MMVHVVRLYKDSNESFVCAGEDEDQFEQFMLPLTAAFETVAQMLSTNTFNEQEAKVTHMHRTSQVRPHLLFQWFVWRLRVSPVTSLTKLRLEPTERPLRTQSGPQGPMAAKKRPAWAQELMELH